MRPVHIYLNGAVTAWCALVLVLALSQPAVAQEPAETAGDASGLGSSGEAGPNVARIDRLLSELADPDNAAWRRAEREVMTEWSKSGSAAMDLLLSRGREALRAGDIQAAIEHLTALTDHAPDFAEGWAMRASAYANAGYFGPSVDDLGRALTLNPRHFGALTGLGAVLVETGDKTRALEVYRAALAIHPHLEQVRAATERLERELRGQDI